MNTQTKSSAAVIGTVIAVLIIGMCLFVPVWQSAVNTELEMRINSVRDEISSYETSKMALRADIANLSTPEYIVEAAIRQNINFTQISAAVI